MGAEALYTNQSECSRGFPSDEQVFAKLGTSLGLEPGLEKAPAVGPDADQGPACSVDDGPTRSTGKVSLAVHSSSQAASDGGCGCGCNVPNSTGSNGSDCC